MRLMTKYFIALLILCFLAVGLYAAAEPTPSKKSSSKSSSKKPATSNGSTSQDPLSMGMVKGPGTEAAVFNDDSLIHTPVPTFTPIYSVKTPEKEVWNLLGDTKSIIIKDNKETKNYNAAFRKNFMNNYNEMGKVVGKLHTQALLDKRDQVEYEWEGTVDKTEQTLALAEEWANEFNEDYKIAEKNQARVEQLLKKYSDQIQRTNEVELKYKHNDEDMFYLKKQIDKFNELFKTYVFKYQEMIKAKEDKVNKLLNEHYELYKP
ncbi:MAG: hypothetical protein WCJ94_04415 [bacterium]